MRGHLIQLRGYQPAKPERRDDADDESAYDGHHSLPNDKVENMACLRTERHAHTDFSRALRDAVCDCAVDAAAGATKRDYGVENQQPRDQPPMTDGLRYDCVPL